MSQFFVNSTDERNARLRDFAFNIMDVTGCGYVDKAHYCCGSPSHAIVRG
jgi:hypothetical protein